jgi:Phage portal protein
VANAHRVAVIEAGKWVPRAFSQRDMQFTELRLLSRDTIMEAYRVHKSMMGISDDVNRANALTGHIVFSESLQVPRLERRKGSLNTSYLPKFGKTAAGLELDYDSPVPASAEDDRADMLTRAQAALAYVQAGFNGTSIVEALDLPDSLIWSGTPASQTPSEPTLVPSARMDRVTGLLALPGGE